MIYDGLSFSQKKEIPILLKKDGSETEFKAFKEPVGIKEILETLDEIALEITKINKRLEDLQIKKKELISRLRAEYGSADVIEETVGNISFKLQRIPNKRFDTKKVEKYVVETGGNIEELKSEYPYDKITIRRE